MGEAAIFDGIRKTFVNTTWARAPPLKIGQYAAMRYIKFDSIISLWHIQNEYGQVFKYSSSLKWCDIAFLT